MKSIRHVALTGVLLMVLISGCKKESVSAIEAAQTSSDISIREKINEIQAFYYARGSRTIYRNIISDTTRITTLDFVWKKYLVYSKTDSSFSCKYGDSELFDQGWRYIITVDKKTGKIILNPNAEMAAAINPGSFVQIAVTYDRVYKSFNFRSQFAIGDRVHEVGEILSL